MILYHGTNIDIQSINLALCRPYKDFGRIPSERWAVFVMNNRSKAFVDFDSLDCNFDYKYDIVAGPIADDDMTILFRQY